MGVIGTGREHASRIVAADHRNPRSTRGFCGANATVEGDFCLVLAAGTTANCEEVASSALARTAAAADRIDAAQQHVGRATAARAAAK